MKSMDKTVLKTASNLRPLGLRRSVTGTPKHPSSTSLPPPRLPCFGWCVPLRPGMLALPPPRQPAVKAGLFLWLAYTVVIRTQLSDTSPDYDELNPRKKKKV